MTSPAAPAADLRPLAGAWTVVPAGSSITFHTKAMWVLNVAGTLQAVEGAGTVGPDGSVQGTLVFDASSIETKNSRRDKHLQTADFFDVATYPTITFTATGARAVGAGPLEVDGTLTIRGITKPISAPTTVAVSGDSATATTEFDLDRSEWGLTWAKLGAGLANHVVVRVALVRAGTAAGTADQG